MLSHALRQATVSLIFDVRQKKTMEISSILEDAMERRIRVNKAIAGLSPKTCTFILIWHGLIRSQLLQAVKTRSGAWSSPSLSEHGDCMELYEAILAGRASWKEKVDTFKASNPKGDTDERKLYFRTSLFAFDLGLCTVSVRFNDAWHEETVSWWKKLEEQKKYLKSGILMFLEFRNQNPGIFPPLPMPYSSPQVIHQFARTLPTQFTRPPGDIFDFFTQIALRQQARSRPRLESDDEGWA